MWKPPEVLPLKLDPNDARHPQWYEPKTGYPSATGTAPDKAEKPKGVNKPIPHHDHHPDSPEMKQFKELFGWILNQTAQKLETLNKAIAKGDAAWYEQARADYIKFVDQINNQEPSSTGAGFTMNWAVIEPRMEQSKGFITGAVVKARWLGGTHSSSSGVRIVH